MRFKSHSAKEDFYKGRKSLGAHRRGIKIRPSLSPAQKTLLTDANAFLETEDSTLYENPPEFVFANVLGQIQVKMKKKCKHGLFVTIRSVAHLTQMILNVNMGEDELQVFDSDNSWAD